MTQTQFLCFCYRGDNNSAETIANVLTSISFAVLGYKTPRTSNRYFTIKGCKRYLKTGVLGKSSYKPKDKDHVDMEVESDNISSLAIDQGKEVQDGGNDKLGTENKEEILTPTITEDHICLQYPNSDQSKLIYVVS
ncbi:hypothetical protein DCAR_0520046 [Daucus carota subsp. sativus]|uniref:Uncharacterized protein n=1 Tax=Daucus carota subsp. sativus TaxID=79200 RepID=A0A164YB49_DAUCS|nr:hypothetical protein DCAR_0520046 [Daucus carota subsp. sativus]